MITFLFILIIIATIFLLFGYKKICLATLISVVVCFLLIGNGFVPAILLNNIQAPYTNLGEYQWKKQNAIVLLGFGATKLPNANVKPLIIAYSRILETAKLYHQCLGTGSKCTIFISGGDALHTGVPEAKVYQEELKSIGINSKDIILEPNSMNTFKNAEFTSKMLQKGKFDNIILVTGGTHLKRSLLYFSYFGVHPKPAIADYIAPVFSYLPLSLNFAITDLVIHEYLGILRFHVYNYFGWNKGSISTRQSSNNN